ncbi:MAG TPA: hypothetical protein VJL29_16375, partial [Thermoguttaceae bacterium]|nr:hypothetical protein [Thermoguttaceae bacterium]
VVAANDHTNNNGSSTNRLVPVSYPTVAPLGESRLLEHGDGRGLLPLCKPRETRPAPQVIIQADPNLRDINRKMDTVIVNTTPPAPDTDDASQEATSPVVLALVIGGAVVIGFVVYFGTQGRD